MTKQVTIYQRKARSEHNTSIELVTRTLLPEMQRALPVQLRIAPCLSNGLWRRLFIALDAAFCRTDVLHVNGDINFAGLFRSRRGNVLSLLDTAFLENASGLKRAILRLFWLALPIRRSAVVTTISDFSRREIIRWLKRDPGNLEVIGVPVSPLFRPSPKAFAADRPTILQVGTAGNKNLGRVIEAVTGLACRLCIVGPLTSEATAQLTARGIDYENHTNVDDLRLVELYERCDLVVFCSTYEGFGMPIVEANATGRPVVTSDRCSMPEVAADAALLVDPLDVAAIRRGITQIIEDPVLRATLIERGFVNARRFDAARIAERFLDVYRSRLAR